MPACEKLKQQVFEKARKFAKDTMKAVPSKYGDKEFVKLTREQPYALADVITFDVVSPTVDPDLNDSYDSFEESVDVFPPSLNPFSAMQSINFNPASSITHVSVFPGSIINPEEFNDELSIINQDSHSESQQSQYEFRDIANPEDEPYNR